MSRKTVLPVAAAFALAVSMIAAPAYAEGEFAITVTPDEARPSEVVHVEGDATDPICEGDGVAVSLHYTKPDGSLAAATVNATTDSAGHFEADVTVPDIAVAGDEAFVSAVIADCTPPSSASVGSRSSVSVPFDVLAYEGEFAISKTSGKPGQVVEFAGTNCWGGAVAVFFGDDVLEGDPEQDKTFEGAYELPDLPGGTYEFGAECPGTDYAVLSFTLINPQAPAAPPAPPVVRTPTFTG